MTEKQESLDLGEIPGVSISYSFQDWLISSGGTVVVTNLSGKLILISWDGTKVTVFFRDFERPTGLALDGDRLTLATHHRTVSFFKSSRLAESYPDVEKGRYDAVYVPQAVYMTGRVNIHDIGVGTDDLWLCNTAFSCLCTLSPDYSFLPRWKPPFISMITPEDRCHLNGLAMVDGRAKYVTSLGTEDRIHSWRQTINGGGCLMDVDSSEFILRGLYMPHSPKWHEDKLYFLNSAAGEFCVVDIVRGKHEVICRLPGMARGLHLMGNYALIALSLLRDKAYDEMPRRPVQNYFEKLKCGVAIVDLLTGKPIGFLEFTSGVGELYDVIFLPGVHRPMIFNLEQHDMVTRACTIPYFQWWLNPDAKEKEKNSQPVARLSPA